MAMFPFIYRPACLPMLCHGIFAHLSWAFSMCHPANGQNQELSVHMHSLSYEMACLVRLGKKPHSPGFLKLCTAELFRRTFFFFTPVTGIYYKEMVQKML